MQDSTPPLVSIGIPTYNRASSYLKDALRSAVNQTYKKIEIIVSDNCSSDDTESVVKAFNDHRIRYYRQKDNIGSLNNRNFCLEQSRGEYFLSLFDDDVIDDDFLSTCMGPVICGSRPGIIVTGAREIGPKGDVLSSAHNTLTGSSMRDFILGWFDRKVPLYQCCIVFNAMRLKQLGGFHSKTNRYDDVVASVQLAAKYGRIDVFGVKASYRRHGSNIGDDAHYSEWCEDSLYLLDVMCNVVPDHEAVIRERGMSYFCRRNYNRVAGIRSPVERLYAYLTVYRTFNYRCSPIKFVCMRNISRIRKFLKRKFQSCAVL